MPVYPGALLFADQAPSKRFLPRDTLVSMPVPYYHIDSFANELFAGNPAGICLVPAFPANDVMQKIAAKNRHSETAVVVGRADGDFDLRWSHRWWKMTCAAMQPWLLRMHFRCVDMTHVRFASIQSVTY